MLTFGSISPGAGSASKWQYTGGTPPGSIETIPGVTGIKNPLSTRPDFLLQFENNVYGVANFGGWRFDDGNIQLTSAAVESVPNQWVCYNQVQDATIGEYALTVLDSAGFYVGADNGTSRMDMTLNPSAFVLSEQTNGALFLIMKDGTIRTNQILPNVSTNTHDYDIPIYDTAGILKGYIKVFRP